MRDEGAFYRQIYNLIEGDLFKNRANTTNADIIFRDKVFDFNGTEGKQAFYYGGKVYNNKMVYGA